MKNNDKITLTIGQLKRLIKESIVKKGRINEGGGAGYKVEMKDIHLEFAKAELNSHNEWTVKGDCTFTGYAEGYDWCTEEKDFRGSFRLNVSNDAINKYIEKYLPGLERDEGTENSPSILRETQRSLERTDAYDIGDLSEMIGRGWSHVKWDGLLESKFAYFDLDDHYSPEDMFDIQINDDSFDIGDSGFECYYCIECKKFAEYVESVYQQNDE